MISRRSVLTGTAAFSALSIPAVARAAIPTPLQTPGPFFPDLLPSESDFDLTSIGSAPPANGEVIEIVGQVMGLDGRPISGATVELWQANAFGRYAHSRDTSSAPLDPNFQGYGAVRTDEAGRYRFLTIRPGLYTGRTRHLHFYAAGPGFERVPMQMYFGGESGNQSDFLYNALRTPEAQRAVTVDFQSLNAKEAPQGRFDIVVDARE